MRIRSAVPVLLSLAIASIACAPRASAALPIAQDQADATPSNAGVVVDLEAHPTFFLVLKSPGVIRLTRFDSTGHPFMRVEVRALPNPASSETRVEGHVQRYTSSLTTYSAARAGFDPGNYAKRSTYKPLPFLVEASNRHVPQRFSTGLRAAALIGTLVLQGRIRS